MHLRDEEIGGNSNASMQGVSAQMLPQPTRYVYAGASPATSIRMRLQLESFECAPPSPPHLAATPVSSQGTKMQGLRWEEWGVVQGPWLLDVLQQGFWWVSCSAPAKQWPSVSPEGEQVDFAAARNAGRSSGVVHV